MKVKEKEKDEAAPSPPPEKVLYDNRIKRKNVLALNEKVAAIREYDKMPVYKRIGRMFHCSPDQIKRIVQQKESILRAWEQRTRRCQDAKTLEMKVVRVSMLGKAVYDWIRRMMYYKDFMITDGLIQKMALQFKSAMGLQNFFPHQEWCDKFRQTYKIIENDSKLLNIAYTQGHSVQIKDVMKDVLSECTPDKTEIESDDELMDENDNKTNLAVKDKKKTTTTKGSSSSSSSSRATTTTTTTTTLTATTKCTKSTNIAGNNTVSARPLPKLQPIRQLVALPIKTNGLGMMPQKVLVATPITTAQTSGSTSTPMTMTIIPLTTLAQQQQHKHKQPQQHQHLQLPVRGQQANTAEKPTVPPPMFEIKQEIKEEPIDHRELLDVCIKEEYDSDEENNRDDGLSDIEDNINENVGNVTHKPSSNIETTIKVSNSNDGNDDEDLVLASLQKVMQNQSINAENKTATTNSVAIISNEKPKVNKTPKQPVPPLIRTPAAINRAAMKRKLNATDSTPIPAIKSCSEARKYLKLVEDFALYIENFRLIGLITRADEVLRELDGDDDDDDVDVD